MKFGGTSVADAPRIRAAADIVRNRVSRRPAVVVSALAGVTDLLLRAAEAARAGEREGLDPVLAEDWTAAPDDAGRLRVVVDQVALLTDQQAVTRHAALVRRA